MDKRIKIEDVTEEDLEGDISIAYIKKYGTNTFGRSFSGNSIGVIQGLIAMLIEVTKDMGFSKEHGSEMVAELYKDYYNDIELKK